jgi:hypothetical protein
VRLTLVGRFEGLDQHEKGQNAPASPFDAFFGGGQQRGVNKGPDAKVEMQVTLEDMYNGNDVSMSIKRRIVCRQCKVRLSLSLSLSLSPSLSLFSLPPSLPPSLPLSIYLSIYLYQNLSAPLKPQAQPIFAHSTPICTVRMQNIISTSTSTSTSGRKQRILPERHEKHHSRAGGFHVRVMHHGKKT